MRRSLPFLFLLSLIPSVAGQQETVPLDAGEAEYRFIAGWVTGDGASVPAGGTQFFAMFGDSSPRSSETDITGQATFYYNVTNFRVSAGTANCGGLGAGQSFSFAVRKNAEDTILTGSCVNGAAANSFTLDTDTVAVEPGDRLTMSVTLAGGILGAALRIGLTLEGFKTVPVTGSVTVDHPNPDWLDMGNFAGLSDEASLGLVIFGLLMIWCLYYGYLWSAFGAFLAVMSQVVIASGFFMFSILWIMLGFGWEVFERNRPRERENERYGQDRERQASNG